MLKVFEGHPSTEFCMTHLRLWVLCEVLQVKHMKFSLKKPLYSLFINNLLLPTLFHIYIIHIYINSISCPILQLFIYMCAC